MSNPALNQKLGDAVEVSDYVANGSFESLRLNVSTSSSKGYAILVRLVDHNAGWMGPFSYVDAPSYEFLRKSRLSEGDVVIANVGANAGTVFRVPNLGMPTTLGPNAVVCHPRDKEQVDRSYLFYYLAGPIGQSLIAGIISGSAQPKFNKTSFRQLPISLPPIREQRAIAEVLGALDDKISANAKVAVTADELVRAALAGLIATAQETVPVSKLVANRKELAEPSALDPASKYLGLEHLPRRSMWATFAGTAESVISTKARFESGDILFGKLRPYFHKVIVAPFGGVCSTDILVLNPLSQELAGYTLASLASDFVVERATAASEGTRMPRTSWKDLASIDLPWPGLTEAKAFSSRVLGLRSSVESLLRENQTLTNTRDALIPQLMSGNLRVKDAEKVLENAGV